MATKDMKTKNSIKSWPKFERPRELHLEKNACAVIFVHNHPSGSRKPSQLDINITKKLVSACQAVDITPLDHIIISPYGHISFKGKGIFYK